jgi:hypothetical protein
VALSGSSAAWARKGERYSASMTVAPFSAASTSPSSRRRLLRNSSTWASVSSLPHLGAAGGIVGGSQSTSSASAALKREPGVVGDDGKSLVHLDDRPHALHRKRRIGVKARHAAAAPRVGAHGGVQHAGQDHVDAVVLGSGRFRDDVEPLVGLAQPRPLRGGPERHVGDGSIAAASAARSV